MKTYEWWDGDVGMGESETLSAESFDAAVRKATWMAMGLIGEQREYELDLYIRDYENRELRRYDVRVTYTDPDIAITEVRE